jgi:O-antigen/teichoic acid export membrane protein
MPTPEPVRPVRAWLGRGVWTVADQAFYAGANLVLNVLLARALAPEAYGAFTTGFIAFLLVGAVHGGVLVEPVLVFGAGRFRDRWAGYLRWAAGRHGYLSVLAALALGLAAAGAFLAGEGVLAASLAGFALAQGGVLALWLLRRACHVVARPELAAGAGALYLGLVAAGAVALDAAGLLSALTAPLLMGAASLGAAAVLARPLGLRAARPDATLAADARTAHRGYGKFSAWTGVLEWGQGALPFLVVPVWAGLEEAAHLRALYTLAMPALQAASALTVMAVPVLVAARTRGALRPTALRLGAVLLGGAAAYGAVMGLFGEPVMTWLYDGRYGAGPALRWALALLPLAAVLAGVCAAVLRAQERPRAVLAARGGAVAVGAALSAGLTATAGVAGALAAEALTHLVEAAAMAVGLRRRAWRVDPSFSGPAPARERVAAPLSPDLVPATP